MCQSDNTSYGTYGGTGCSFWNLETISISIDTYMPKRESAVRSRAAWETRTVWRRRGGGVCDRGNMRLCVDIDRSGVWISTSCRSLTRLLAHHHRHRPAQQRPAKRSNQITFLLLAMKTSRRRWFRLTGNCMMPGTCMFTCAMGNAQWAVGMAKKKKTLRMNVGHERHLQLQLAAAQRARPRVGSRFFPAFFFSLEYDVEGGGEGGGSWFRDKRSKRSKRSKAVMR